MVGEDRFEGEASGLDGRSALVPKVAQSIRRADDKLVALVKERPIAAVTGALIFGYLIGRLIGGRS